MAPPASPVITMPQARQRGQFPASTRPAQADPETAGPGDNRLPRPLEVTQCSLCGSTRPLGLLVPDGGRACADVRWYCKDVRSCTERWVAASRRSRASWPVTPGDAAVAAPAPAEAPAELPGTPAARPGGPAEEAQPAPASASG